MRSRRIPLSIKVLPGLSAVCLAMGARLPVQLPAESTAFRQAQLTSPEVKTAEKLS
nr:hypothetical protein [Tanacetum cinerariifolium]